MLDIIRKLFSLFTRNERRQLYWLVCAILLMGIIEITGVVSIMPFMAMVADPDIISKNRYFQLIYDNFGFTSPNQFLFFLGVVVLLILTLSNAFSALITWLMLRFSNMRGHSLSERLLANYLGEPYVFFLNHNTSELIKNIFSEVGRVISGVLMPLMITLTKLVSVLFILMLLVLVNPMLALIVIITLGSAYIFVYLLVRNRLASFGNKIGQFAGERYKLASEALGGIKDLKLLGKEEEFIHRYSEPSSQYAVYNASSQIITQLPRFALEIIAFGGILLIVLYLLDGDKDLSEVLPLIALYAFAGYRLMPSLQQIYANVSTMRYNYAALELLYNDFYRFSKKYQQARELPTNNTKTSPLDFQNNIELHEIVYRYPNTSENVINDLNTTISANTTIGIVGSTGSGKTTIIDIILGLLKPDEGSLKVDGVTVTSKTVRNWQLNLGYVPQSIYLTDDTITKNIAFGVPDEEINNEAVKKAANIANIDKFIINELPGGFETLVGERGVRLSGGQRQRIGIARALYRDPKVLILDEATSALDGITENAIMDAINKLAHRKTIIMIAHRLTTVKECDVIYVMEGGKITESGTYSELIGTSRHFRDMASLFE